MSVNVEGLVSQRHEPPEWAVLYEFAGGVGSAGYNRRADVVAFNCWPSKGFLRIAYEVKRTRADFMREVDAPEKRAWLEKHFHQCYFAVTDGIVKADEVPEGWGLLVVTKGGDKIIRRKAAKHRDVGKLPEALALSAIRRLNQRLLDLQHGSYEFEGEKLTQADIDVKVAKTVHHHLEMLNEKHTRFDKLVREANDAKAKFMVPFEVLSRAAGDFQYARRWTGNNAEIPTANQINAWVAEIRRKACSNLMKQLRMTHGQLGSLIEDMRKAGLDPDSLPSTPNKQGEL